MYEKLNHWKETELPYSNEAKKNTCDGIDTITQKYLQNRNTLGEKKTVRMSV